MLLNLYMQAIRTDAHVCIRTSVQMCLHVSGKYNNRRYGQRGESENVFPDNAASRKKQA